MPLLLTDTDIDQLMTMTECVEVIEDSFRQVGNGQTWNRPRSRIRMPRGFHHLMAASVLGSEVFGLKTYTSFRSGVRFIVMLYDSNNGDLLAMVQGERLTQLRTGAVTSVAQAIRAGLSLPACARLGTSSVSRHSTAWRIQSGCFARKCQPSWTSRSRLSSPQRRRLKTQISLSP